jgi:AmmeMemoRadiSam system protein A
LINTQQKTWLWPGFLLSIEELLMAGERDTQTAGLSVKQGRALLWLARETIARQFDLHAKKPDSEIVTYLRDQELQQKMGTFVTLKEHGELRGCIGSLAPIDSIVEGVKRNALNSAFHDPRFKPVEMNELAAIEVEISILTIPKPLNYANADDLIRILQVGIDGVIIQKGGQSATFLPQVWEQLSRPDVFLSHLCHKAGLPAEAWRSGSLEVFTYQVQYFVDEHG